MRENSSHRFPPSLGGVKSLIRLTGRQERGVVGDKDGWSPQLRDAGRNRFPSGPGRRRAGVVAGSGQGADFGGCLRHPHNPGGRLLEGCVPGKAPG